jgi:hypothetical protein
MGRQVGMNKICYLHDMYLFLPTPDILVGQEAS